MKTLILNIKQLVQTELSPRKWVAGKDMARLGIPWKMLIYLLKKIKLPDSEKWRI